MPVPRQIVVLAVVFEGVLLAFAIGVGLVLGRSPFHQLELRWDAVPWGIVATGPLILSLIWGLRSGWGPLRRVLRAVDELIVPLFARCSVFDFAVISLAAGIGEEVFFRGLIQPALGDVAGPVAGLFITSAIFGLAHLITPTYAVLAGVIGLYLGSLVLAFENLFIVILAHALYDFVALLYLRSRADGRRENGRTENGEWRTDEIQD